MGLSSDLHTHVHISACIICIHMFTSHTYTRVKKEAEVGPQEQRVQDGIKVEGAIKRKGSRQGSGRGVAGVAWSPLEQR